MSCRTSGAFSLLAASWITAAGVAPLLPGESPVTQDCAQR
jgi:hypothetical protein